MQTSKPTNQTNKQTSTPGTRPPVPGCNVAYITWRMRRVIESIYFRFTTILLILIDLIVVIIDLAVGGRNLELEIADLIFSIYFVLEVSARLVVLHPRVFFIHWYNTLDFAVVFCTFIISCVALSGTGATIEYFALFTIFRGVRLIRIVRIFSEKQVGWMGCCVDGVFWLICWLVGWLDG